MQAVPAYVQLEFTQVRASHKVQVKVYNASSHPSRLHLYPVAPRSVFKATLEKHSTLAPGMYDVLNINNFCMVNFLLIEIDIKCIPIEYKHYQEKVKLSSENGDTLEIPLEAYPVMNKLINTCPTTLFPKNIDFGACVICTE